MSNFFKKAVSLFVEFEPEINKPTYTTEDHLPRQSRSENHLHNTPATPNLTHAEMDKFGAHFEELFDKANLSGPDYYEFWKMMETLKTAVPDEKVRMAAVYATFKVQGLSKETLLKSANQYQQVIQADKTEFQNAVNQKVHNEIIGRKGVIENLEKTNAANSERIKQISEEIAANQSKITSLKKEIIDEDDKINNRKNGYNIACDAMVLMIANDIQKINKNL